MLWKAMVALMHGDCPSQVTATFPDDRFGWNPAILAHIDGSAT
jgi:hypothetical protein